MHLRSMTDTLLQKDGLEKLTTSLTGPEMGSLPCSAHQPAHSLKRDSYDLDDLLHHEASISSVASVER